MQKNKLKYLILILIAFFFSSTNEICAKEAQQNYNVESHSFLETANYSLISSIDKHKNNYQKLFTPDSFFTSPDFYYNKSFVSYSYSELKAFPQIFHNNIYIDISIFRI